MKSKLSVCWAHHALVCCAFDNGCLLFCSKVCCSLATHFLSSSFSDPWTKSVPHQSKKSKYKDCGQDSGGPELVKKSNNGLSIQNRASSFIFRTSEVPIPSSPGVKIPIPVRSSSPDDFEVNIIIITMMLA